MTHILFLDGLRGIAIIMVLLFHFWILPLAQYLYNPFFFNLGHFLMHGVTLFFVLSGFLIGGILITNKSSKKYFQTFYVRRFLRIIPLYYLLLAIYYLLKFTIYSDLSSSITTSKIPDWTYPFFLQSIYIPEYGLGPRLISASWSLCVEEQFYLIAPAIIYYVPKNKLLILILSTMLLALISRSLFPGINGLGELTLITSRIDALLIGVIIAIIYQSNTLKTELTKVIKEIRILLLTLSFGILLSFQNFSLGTFRLTWIALFFGIIILIALIDDKSTLRKIFQAKPFRFIGKYSYGIYLSHMPIHYLTQGTILKGVRLFENQILDVIFLNSISIIFCIIISYIIFEVFENKMISLGKKYRY
jgi:peptidoglycan/LPS O-acetylase OafA/YrhL